MIVDDDAGIRHSVGRLLEEDGHEVLREAHGKDALRHFAGEPVDLVISDIYMPEMDGIEFLMRIREAFPEVRIIMMSAGGRLSADAVLEASSALGANRVLKKPLSTEELRDAVREVLATQAD